MKKLSEDELLRLACIYAEQDREAFVEAYEHIPKDKEAVKARSFLKQMKSYRLKRWGRTKYESSMANAKQFTLNELMNRKATP